MCEIINVTLPYIREERRLKCSEMVAFDALLYGDDPWFKSSEKFKEICVGEMKHL
jgi:hypothetical protein